MSSLLISLKLVENRINKGISMAIVSFVSDADFDLAVKHVVDAISSVQEFECSVKVALESGNVFSCDLFSNGLDPFAMKFGMELSSDKSWLATEVKRQIYKTFEQRIGEFHQKLLGSVDGWQDLGVGDESKVDLCNDEQTIFIELKNKFNTCNSDALAKVHEKLLKIVTDSESRTAYWAYIVPSVKKKQDIVLWKKKVNKRQVSHPRLYKAWGASVYELVTKKPEALHETYVALSKRIPVLNKTSDTLDSVAVRIISLLEGCEGGIKEQAFYGSVATKQ